MSRPTHPNRPEPATHLFEVGQSVRFRNRLDRPSRSADVFQITRRLPDGGGALQYRIRSEAERHERVTTEDMLEAVSAKSGDSLEISVFGTR